MNNRVIRQADVARHAEAYLATFPQLRGWRFRFNTRKGSLGVCRYRHRTVELSVYTLNLSWAEVEDTLKHEVAHAIAGSHAKHGFLWQQVARQLGARPVRCSRATADDMQIEFRYHATCPRCGKVFKCHKRSRGWQSSCSTCTPGRFDSTNVLVWEDQFPDRQSRRARRQRQRTMIGRS